MICSRFIQIQGITNTSIVPSNRFRPQMDNNIHSTTKTAAHFLLPLLFLNYLYFSTYVNETITYLIVYKQINIMPISPQTACKWAHKQWKSQLVQIISSIKIDGLYLLAPQLLEELLYLPALLTDNNKKKSMDNTLSSHPFFSHITIIIVQKQRTKVLLKLNELLFIFNQLKHRRLFQLT